MFEGIAPLLTACLHDSDTPPAQENKMQWQTSKNPTKPGSIHAAAATPNNKGRKRQRHFFFPSDFRTTMDCRET